MSFNIKNEKSEEKTHLQSEFLLRPDYRLDCCARLQRVKTLVSALEWWNSL